MTRNRNHEAAVGRTVLACDHTPARLVRRIIEHYQTELRRAPLLLNPRVMLLANLKVGERCEWPYAFTQVKGHLHYLHTIDKNRARIVLGEPNAYWDIVTQHGKVWAKRVR